MLWPACSWARWSRPASGCWQPRAGVRGAGAGRRIGARGEIRGGRARRDAAGGAELLLLGLLCNEAVAKDGRAARFTTADSLPDREEPPHSPEPAHGNPRAT